MKYNIQEPDLGHVNKSFIILVSSRLKHLQTSSVGGLRPSRPGKIEADPEEASHSIAPRHRLRRPFLLTRLCDFSKRLWKRTFTFMFLYQRK